MDAMVRLPLDLKNRRLTVGPEHRMDVVRCHYCLHHYVAVHVGDAYPDADFQCPRCHRLTGYSVSEITPADFKAYDGAVPEVELSEEVRSPKNSVPRFSERRPRRRRS